jgi:hypothetical protein
LTEDSQDFSREEKPVLYPIFRVFLNYYTLLFTRTLYMDYFSKDNPYSVDLKSSFATLTLKQRSFSAYDVLLNRSILIFIFRLTPTYCDSRQPSSDFYSAR